MDKKYKNWHTGLVKPIKFSVTIVKGRNVQNVCFRGSETLIFDDNHSLQFVDIKISLESDTRWKPSTVFFRAGDLSG